MYNKSSLTKADDLKHGVPLSYTPIEKSHSNGPQNGHVTNQVGQHSFPSVQQYHMSQHARMNHQMMGGPHSFSPQIYPYTMIPAVFDITKCKDPNVACCPSCNHIAMTRVEKKFSTCQIILGVILICSVVMIVPGILILALSSDYEHFCTRCKRSIGKNKTFCC